MKKDMFTFEGYIFIPKNKKDLEIIADILKKRFSEGYCQSNFIKFCDGRAFAFCTDVISVAKRPIAGGVTVGNISTVYWGRDDGSNDYKIGKECPIGTWLIVQSVLQILKKSGIELKEHGFGFFVKMS
jgi:repressor of nif and glnA expression